MKKRGLLLGVFILVAMLFACAPKEKPLAPQPVTPEDKPTAKEAWQVEWDNTLKEARKEGKVVLYTTMGTDERLQVGKFFKEKYGLELEAISAGGAQISEKLLTERRAGLYLADVHVGGLVRIIGQLKPAGALDPLEPELILPEVKEPKYWYKGVLPWLAGEEDRITLRMSLSVNTALNINTNFVKPEEIKSLKDLLHPKWKGKIIMGDPSTPGAAGSWFSQMVDALGKEYFLKFVQQDPFILGDQRLTAEWVARGKYPIGIALDATQVAILAEAGAPIIRYAAQETYLTSSGSCVSLVNRAPHRNAARIFINWLLTREGQTIFSKLKSDEQSARIDVPTDHLPPSAIRQPGVEYAQDSLEKVNRRVSDLQLAKEIFGPLLK